MTGVIIDIDASRIDEQAQMAVASVRRGTDVLVRMASDDEWREFVAAMERSKNYADVVLCCVRRGITAAEDRRRGRV